MTKKSVSTKPITEAVDEIVQPTVVEKSKVEKTVSHRSSVSYPRFGIITLVIAVIGVAMSVEGLWKIREWNAGITTFRVELEHRLDDEQNRLNTLEASLKNIDDRQRKLNAQFTYYRSVILPILQERHPVDLVWQMQKVHNWIQQAQLDLRWSGDWQGALLLMKAAHSVLVQSKIPQLDATTQLLADDITALSKATPIDNTAILAKIQALSDEIVTLPIPVIASVSTAAASSGAASTTTEQPPIWRRVWASIKHIVIIRPAKTSDASGEGLTVERSRHILNDNIYMALQQTQWALLKKDDKTFHWELEQVMDTIQKNGALIDLNNAKTVTCLQNVATLQQQNLNPVLPDLHPVSQQLKAYVVDVLLAKEKAA